MWKTFLKIQTKRLRVIKRMNQLPKKNSKRVKTTFLVKVGMMTRTEKEMKRVSQ